MLNTNKQLVGSIALVGLVFAEAVLIPLTACATTPAQAPVLLSQNEPGSFKRVFLCDRFDIRLAKIPKTDRYVYTLPNTPTHLSQKLLGEGSNFTQTFSCGRFRVTLTANYFTSKYTYRTSGLTLTNGVYERAYGTYSFRNGSYVHSLQDRGDGSGELNVVKFFPDGRQNLQVHEGCTVKGLKFRATFAAD
ncbi:MAG: hypothetical protein JO235_12835 [Chroococcidiopsidaceae cyanobacterium CP_BM_RX_35]|nr:hypothetical protein [Chroococcidiopsidaceae cyanobacterium CP_BM_RX_35]